MLILHSQQNELEALGAGFGDQFAVHLATTGSEALATLGETPIHIIVSALDLPGMSGIETLREAKKRVPDMLGILLAGERGGEDIEALVGEKEVYQVVRGNIATEELVDIVASAARMLVLSKSANDNEAVQPELEVALRDTDPQFKPQDIKPTGEHIILETLDNGAEKVTDASDRAPILKSIPASGNAAATEQSVDVLVLSKDHTFVDTIRAAARGLHTVHHAITAHQAHDIVASNKVGVLVTDAAVAGNKVELLTHKLRSRAPRLVAIIAGRRDDGESLMELINKGQIYRFLLKPVSAGRAKLAVEASAKYHLEAPDSAFLGRKQGGHDALPSVSGAETDTFAALETAESTTNVDKVTRDEPTEAPEQAEEFVVPPDQYLDMDAPDGFDNPVRLPLIPTAIVGAAVLSICAWYFLSNPSGDAANPRQIEATPATSAVADAVPQIQTAPDSVSTAAPAIPSTSNPATEDAYVSLLDNARFARDSGRLLVPENDNALRWYLEARLAAPDNAIVRDELAALIDQLIGRAETAMLDNRIGDVDAILQKVTLADPANSRLAFLQAQRDQQQIRAMLDEARAAIRDGRFVDADQSLSVASTLPGITPAAIEPLVDDLAAARGAQQVDELLALANLRLAENR
ncbi:MAG: hypothetical protein HKP32_05680, partial [Woeseia sp.]|nr:hypothetical protein [Woeseia sp.]